MDLKYKPSKPQRTKSTKAAKAASVGTSFKVDKPIKFASTAKTVKTPKPSKPARISKPQKDVAFAPSSKVGKVEKATKLQKSGGLNKPINPKVAIGIIVALIVIAVVVVAVAVPAAKKHGEEIDHVMISSTPDKTVYLIGEEVNYDGLRVLVTRKNGETFTVRASKCQITGFDSSTAAESQTITVSYEGFTATYSISVEEPPKPAPVLMGISLDTLPKTEYKVGETLDTTGGVIAREYKDGSVAYLTLVNSYIFGWEEVDGPGTYTLTVKYIENGIRAETTYTITVTK